MKVLVTGFKPFNNNYNNYSSEVLQFINNVDKLIIDVKYNQCYLEIMRQVDVEKYDYHLDYLISVFCKLK